MEDVEHMRVRVWPDQRVNRPDAAKLLGRKAKTLADWKLKGWGPRPIHVGSRVFYDYREVLEMARGEKPIVPVAA